MTSSGPAMPLPPGDRSPVLLGLVWAFPAVSTAVYAARMYVRHRYTGKFGADDFWMGGTVFLSLVFTVLMTVDVMNGFGRHFQYAETISTPQTIVVLDLTTMLIATLETLTIKLSITSFLLRLRPSRGYQLLIWAVIIANAVTIVLGFVICLTQCQPLSKAWDPTQPGTCWPQSVMIGSFYTICVVCTVSWWIYILLPIAYTWNLQLPAYTKRAIWGLMGLGLIPAVFSVLKIPFSVDFTNPDVTWAQVNFFIVFTVEMNMGIIVASIPPLKPVIDSRWPGLLTASNRGSSSKGSLGRVFFKMTGTNKSTGSGNKSMSSTADMTKDQTVVINGSSGSRDRLDAANADPSCILVEHHISVEHQPHQIPLPGTSEGQEHHAKDWESGSMA